VEHARDAASASSLPAAAALVAALPCAAVLVGPDDTLLAGNPAALDLFAHPGQTSLPGVFKDLDAAQRIVGLRAAVDEARRNGAPVILSAVEWRNGSVDVTVSPVESGGGGVALVTAIQSRWRPAVAHEELETLNEELRTANEALAEQVRQLAEAEAADARKNQFMAMLAHELRNPLGAVVNALHVISRLAPGDRQVAHAVRIAERQLRHEARLLDDLLDVSRIVLNKITLRPRPLDLRDSIRSVVEGAALGIQSQALTLTVELPSAPLTVAGDATRLEQCIGNLLSNAIKFTPAGGRIRVGARRENAQAVVIVADEGVGIAPELLERVFDLFAQGDASLARSRGGLGIGLTLVRRLVDLHGGRVTARSAGPGRGSEFEIRLPLVEDTGATAAAPPAPATGSLRVLVIEDNRDAREMLRLVLEMEGHSVVETGDAASAVRLAAENAPDVVIIDVGLPDIDGFEVARRIRGRLGADVRLIAVTGYGDAEAHTRGREAGFDAHLIKPVEPAMLLRTLARERSES
jgi:two-component system, sensor histidine kinase